MVGWIDQPSLVPIRQHLETAPGDSAAGERFLAEVIGRMATRSREPDGRGFERFRRVNVLAAK